MLRKKRAELAYIIGKPLKEVMSMDLDLLLKECPHLKDDKQTLNELSYLAFSNLVKGKK